MALHISYTYIKYCLRTFNIILVVYIISVTDLTASLIWHLKLYMDRIMIWFVFILTNFLKHIVLRVQRLGSIHTLSPSLVLIH